MISRGSFLLQSIKLMAKVPVATGMPPTVQLTITVTNENLMTGKLADETAMWWGKLLPSCSLCTIHRHYVATQQLTTCLLQHRRDIMTSQYTSDSESVFQVEHKITT